MATQQQLSWGECLDPSTIDVKFKDCAGATHEFTLTELPKKSFEAYVGDCYYGDEADTQEAPDTPGKKALPKIKARDLFTQHCAEHTGFMVKYLALSCRDDKAHNDSYFKKLLDGEIPTGVYIKLIEALYDLNHVEQVASSMGNLLMVPVLRPSLEPQPSV